MIREIKIFQTFASCSVGNLIFLSFSTYNLPKIIVFTLQLIVTRPGLLLA